MVGLARLLMFGGAIALLTAVVPLAPATAQHDSGHSGGKGGSETHSGGGHDSGGGHESGGHEEDEHGGRKGGPGSDGRKGAPKTGGHSSGVEGKILRSGGPGSDRGQAGAGGKPAWAGGGIPEGLELGRLNVARAPRSVLDRALAETYGTNLDKNSDGILDADADLAAIDSPRANLALYREAVSGARRVSGAWTSSQAAAFLGKAADKNLAIGTETVAAVNLMLGIDADESSFSYDRAAAHPQEIAVVFGGENYTGTGPEAFAKAADDTRTILKYAHDHPN